MDTFWRKFWSNVQRTDSCWLWQGPVESSGYGCCVYSGRTKRVHRLAFLAFYGFLPPVVHHVCRNRSCVRPEHLMAYTKSAHTLHHRIAA